MILVTGGAGFIGSNFIIDWLTRNDEPVLNIDCLSYAGHINNLMPVKDDARHIFVKADISDTATIARLLQRYRPRAIVHFAAESHVDRSITGPAAFINTNITGTFNLLSTARDFWETLAAPQQLAFRFLQVSTDEVYGSLTPQEAPFDESRPYAPNNPYAASKAAADHLVRAFWRTYGLPTITTISSNNYGPCQFPEKLIPLMIVSAITGKILPVYGDGLQRRDWLHVTDHCAAIRQVLQGGRVGEVYHIGANDEKSNIDIVNQLCDVLDDLLPQEGDRTYRDQITLVQDRLGHDRRYAIDAAKMTRELNWRPMQTFETGIRSTVQWYLDKQANSHGAAL